ncbi:hypothetical protein MASR2M29_13390 [Spirochaetota bacterium]
MESSINSKPKIAICEDEKIIALDLQSFLHRNGYQPGLMVSNAEELLDSIEENRPDIVLMDIKLQGEIDGIEAASILYEKWRIPVILLTAFTDSHTIERAKFSHPYAYIIKPYNERELKIAISIGLFRASMEKKLKESEERYKLLFSSGITATMLIDTGGSIMEYNEAFARLVSNAITIWDILGSESLKTEIAAALKNASSVGPVETCFNRNNSSLVWIILSIAPILLPDGRQAFQGQAIDITYRKQLEEELGHNQKLSALGRLSGGVAHDINNVLTAILGYARLLRFDLEAWGKESASLDGIEKAVSRAASLTRQLMVFSRREKTAPSYFRLSELCRESEIMLKRYINPNIKLSLFSFSDKDWIYSDPVKIEMAIINLVINARDALPNGGLVKLSTGIVNIKKGAATNSKAKPGRWAYLEVEDNGKGIDPEILEKIFQPFFTTKKADQGTGLGLSTVLMITQASDGHILVDSAPEWGTKVRLLFPVAKKSDALADETEALQDENNYYYKLGTGKTLLLVIRDDVVRTILEGLLSRGGFQVHSTREPGEALLMAEQFSLDAAISDYVMPLISGEELAIRLRKLFPDLAMLFLEDEGSLQHQADQQGKAKAKLALHFDEKNKKNIFLYKPFKEDELFNALAILLSVQEKE